MDIICCISDVADHLLLNKIGILYKTGSKYLTFTVTEEPRRLLIVVPSPSTLLSFIAWIVFASIDVTSILVL